MLLFDILSNKLQTPAKENALKGRADAIASGETHFVNGKPYKKPFPKDYETIYLALGCFWGAERLFWSLEGVYATAVGYIAGHTPNPTYHEVCTGGTGHTEAVIIVFDPTIIGIQKLLQIFWESHDPTQGMRQGNDRGTQYRSGIYFTSDDQKSAAEHSKLGYQQALAESQKGKITTEIKLADTFYYAEEHHQQYLAKNPDGYCGIGGTGVACPIPVRLSNEKVP